MKIDFGKIGSYALPVLMGIGTIIAGINEKKASDRNQELEQKIDELNKKLDKGEA